MPKVSKKPDRVVKSDNAVEISDEQYERLVLKSHQPKSIVEFFRQSPLVGVKLDLDRDQDTGPDIEWMFH